VFLNFLSNKYNMVFSFIKNFILLLIISNTCVAMFLNINFIKQGFLITILASFIHATAISVYSFKSKQVLVVSAYLSAYLGVLIQSYLASHSFGTYDLIDLLSFYSIMSFVPISIWSISSTIILIYFRHKV
jgi:hypothetical protein